MQVGTRDAELVADVAGFFFLPVPQHEGTRMCCRQGSKASVDLDDELSLVQILLRIIALGPGFAGMAQLGLRVVIRIAVIVKVGHLAYAVESD